jgi:hypothetical protein
VPSTVEQIFSAAGVKIAGLASWGVPLVPPDDGRSATGIYVVALPRRSRPFSEAPVSGAAIDVLLAARPELMLDGARPTPDQLISRLGELWLPDEEVVYVGLAGPRRSRPRGGELPRRVQEFYETRLGDRSPHAGGWPVKTLGCLHQLQVYYGYCEKVEEAERDALAAFAANVSEETRGSLRDAERIMPFANLEFPRGVRKRHGIPGARAPRETATRRKGGSRPNADRAPSLDRGGNPRIRPREPSAPNPASDGG